MHAPAGQFFYQLRFQREYFGMHFFDPRMQPEIILQHFLQLPDQERILFSDQFAELFNFLHFFLPRLNRNGRNATKHSNTFSIIAFIFHSIIFVHTTQIRFIPTDSLLPRHYRRRRHSRRYPSGSPNKSVSLQTPWHLPHVWKRGRDVRR